MAMIDGNFAERVATNWYASAGMPGVQEAFGAMNAHQMNAAALLGGKAAVLGTPGSGKTRVLVNTIARLYVDRIATPESMLAMTFTKHAAAEMNDRLEQMLGATAANIRVGTIHSVARQILLDLWPHDFTWELDERGRLQMELKKTIAELQRAKKLPSRGINKDTVASFISHAKARGLGTTAGDPLGFNAVVEGSLYDYAFLFAARANTTGKALLNVFEAYEERRRLAALYDFDDMLQWAWQALVSADPSALLKWAGRWNFVLVDEVQDSSIIQWDMARLLAGLPSEAFGNDNDLVSLELVEDAGPYLPRNPRVASGMQGGAAIAGQDAGFGNLWAYGDPAQSLYSWRGAVPATFVDFCKKCEDDGALMRLPINYRSTEAICDVATKLIDGEDWNLAGAMEAGGPNAPLNGMLEARFFDTPYDESQAAVEWAIEVGEWPGGAPHLNDVFILSRTAVALDMLEMHCLRDRIPYRKLSGRSFLESSETKDILAYLRAASGMDPDGSNTRRAVNRPFRMIGAAWLNACRTAAQADGVHLLDMMHQRKYDLHRRQQSVMDEFFDVLRELNQLAIAGMEFAQNATAKTAKPYGGPAAMISTMLARTDYIEHLRREEGLGEDDARLAAIEELQRIASAFMNVQDFLVYVDEMKGALDAARRSGLRRPAVARGGTTDKEDALTLATIHAVKGLEREHVWIADVTPGRFPHEKNPLQDEELRLFYVAITRAKKTCIVSSSGFGSGINGSNAHAAYDDESGMEPPYALTFSVLTRPKIK